MSPQTGLQTGPNPCQLRWQHNIFKREKKKNSFPACNYSQTKQRTWVSPRWNNHQSVYCMLTFTLWSRWFIRSSWKDFHIRNFKAKDTSSIWRRKETVSGFTGQPTAFGASAQRTWGNGLNVRSSQTHRTYESPGVNPVSNKPGLTLVNPTTNVVRSATQTDKSGLFFSCTRARTWLTNSDSVNTHIETSKYMCRHVAQRASVYRLVFSASEQLHQETAMWCWQLKACCSIKAHLQPFTVLLIYISNRF